MIISASRRTDIPAFYAPWLMTRLRAGWCEVPNPFNSAQVSRVDLSPAAVDGLVFWTRFPRPMLCYLDELETMGHAFYFLFTLTGYPRSLDARGPSLDAAVRVFRDLAERIGPHRVRWRYDPIVFAHGLDADYHRRRFEALAKRLEGATERVIVSVLEPYAKARRRLTDVPGIELDKDRLTALAGSLLPDLADMARASSMQMDGCALWESLEPIARDAGIVPSRCVDPELVARLSGRPVESARDGGQRPRCGCAPSRDIGMYESCGFGCRYCYATQRFDAADANRSAHDPEAPALLGTRKDAAAAPHADQHSLL